VAHTSQTNQFVAEKEAEPINKNPFGPESKTKVRSQPKIYAENILRFGQERRALYTRTVKGFDPHQSTIGQG